MARSGRVEARIVVPAGGWTVGVSDGAGSLQAVVEAGEYDAADLVGAIARVTKKGGRRGVR